MPRNILTNHNDIELCQKILDKYPYVLEKLLNDWSKFIEEVEILYTGNIFDYTNDFGTRNILDDVMHAISHKGQNELNEHLLPWDIRFQSATYALSTPLRAGIRKPPGWWCYRIPIILNDELKSDLQDLGFI